jgi:hypothetical protein
VVVAALADSAMSGNETARLSPSRTFATHAVVNVRLGQSAVH